MRLTVSRAVFAAIVAQLAIDALSLTRMSFRPMPLYFVGGVLVVRAALYAGIAVLAVRSGRRWSAPLFSVAAALAPTMISASIGILTGQFLALGFGPAAVLSWLIAVTLLSALSGTAGALVTLLQSRRETSDALAG